MPCCGIIPGASNLNPTLREEVLHKHTITQICAPPSDQQKKGSDNVRAWMRVLLCLATFSTSLICAAFLVQSEAEADTFCACISGEEVTTDVVATCSVQGSSEFSCPYDCLFGGSPVNADNWRTEWNTDSFCGGHSDVAGAYTCEPTVACCVAFMDHLEERNKDHSGEHYSDWYSRTGSSTVQEIKEYECSGWIYDLYINTFVSYCFNKLFGFSVDWLLFKGKPYSHGGVALCIVLMLGAVAAPAQAASAATHYGSHSTAPAILLNWGISAGTGTLILDPLTIAIFWCIGKKMAGEVPNA